MVEMNRLWIKNKHMHRQFYEQKGIYGEELVKRFLKKYGFSVKRGIEVLPGKLSKQYLKPFYFVAVGNHILTPKELEEYNKKHRGFLFETDFRKAKKKFGTVFLPDFKIVGEKIFVEAKAHKDKVKLNPAQKRGFPKILGKGYRILIAIPTLRFDGNKVFLVKIVWKEFLGKGLKSFDFEREFA
ncbi:MAG: hypothetical protein KJ655_04445 [Candidatus Thermoplasmatota archaeon]|nr:hypothetical protein [Candidatus Thermoplasmatota archaeon]